LILKKIFIILYVNILYVIILGKADMVSEQLKSHWWFIPITAACLALALFVKWPFVVQSPCYFSAVEEWELVQNNPSRLFSRLKQNAQMKVASFTNLQFDRQDFLQCSFDPKPLSGQTVEKNQVLGEIESSENQIQLADFQGQLNTARANLRMIQTGQKEAVQKEAMEALNLAKTQYTNYLPLYKRNQKLLEQHLISDEQWEMIRSTEERLRQNVQVQEAQLQVVRTGEKQETIRMIQADVARLEDQLQKIQNKISLAQIRTPIAGVFSNSLRDSILCRVSRLDSVVCTLMVRSDQIPYVRRGQTVTVRNAETGFRNVGTIFVIDQKSTMVSGRPMFMVTACVENTGGKILPGMLGQAAVFTDRASMLERIHRAWNRRAGQIYL
jgi:biotin carboxyl carrier protein